MCDKQLNPNDDDRPVKKAVVKVVPAVAPAELAYADSYANEWKRINQTVPIQLNFLLDWYNEHGKIEYFHRSDYVSAASYFCDIIEEHFKQTCDPFYHAVDYNLAKPLAETADILMGAGLYFVKSPTRENRGSIRVQLLAGYVLIKAGFLDISRPQVAVDYLLHIVKRIRNDHVHGWYFKIVDGDICLVQRHPIYKTL